jgi:hypothetical protein
MMPPLPGLPLQRDSPQLIITNTIVSTMPARHRDRDSGSRRKLSTIRPSACPRRAGMSVHDVLESLDSISRNNQARGRATSSWLNFFRRMAPKITSLLTSSSYFVGSPSTSRLVTVTII